MEKRSAYESRYNKEGRGKSFLLKRRAISYSNYGLIFTIIFYYKLNLWEMIFTIKIIITIVFIIIKFLKLNTTLYTLLMYVFYFM